MRFEALARVRAAALDRELAAGVAPWRSPLHQARAAQLTSRRQRRAVALSLEQLLTDVLRPPTVSAAIPPCREQVLDAAPAITAVARRLRSPGPLDARGVARLRVLLTDGTGPAYARRSGGSLATALQTANQWLDAST